ncbi:cuticle protein 19.8 isoform X2 [Bicyclus anynana]|uniref:Cuticle protein 19.8 isoform X2 n=1 Tax=Bicyclus anynana TaxID=110368 RepID=A0A6J1MNH3_BICAN|nr:cuticle protein 19.8 isoform X2 [Bicyclus anynana]
MLRQCITLAVLGCAFATPIAQYQIQQQDEGIPPHLLRQYIGGGQAQAQHIPRPAPQPAPAPARLPYNVQEEQYQPRPQYQPQPQAPPQQQYRPQQQREPEDYDPHPSYQFGFDVNDDQFTNYQNRKEQREGDVIKGSYSVVDSDGFIRTVTYTADPKEGFRAEVSRQPTDIVVKIPTPKPQVLQPQVPQLQQQHQQQHQPQHQQQQRPQQQQNPQYYRYE